MARYIGLDVHKATCTMVMARSAPIDSSGGAATSGSRAPSSADAPAIRRPQVVRSEKKPLLLSAVERLGRSEVRDLQS